MAIHAKTNGMLIGGKILEETPDHWKFQAMDNKRPTIVSKTDARNRVFEGETALDEALAWQEVARKALKKKRN